MKKRESSQCMSFIQSHTWVIEYEKNVIDVDAAVVFYCVETLFLCLPWVRNIQHATAWLAVLCSCFWKEKVMNKSLGTDKLLENLPLPDTIWYMGSWHWPCPEPGLKCEQSCVWSVKQQLQPGVLLHPPPVPH